MVLLFISSVLASFFFSFFLGAFALLVSMLNEVFFLSVKAFFEIENVVQHLTKEIKIN